MKQIAAFAAATAAIVMFVAGCEKTTVKGPGDKSLTIVKPVDQTLKRGETNQVLVAIDRGNFRDPVEVRFENLPAGVKVQDQETKIAAGDKTGTFTLKAEPNANLVENHVVNITVVGPDGMKATESFKISVKEKT